MHFVKLVLHRWIYVPGTIVHVHSTTSLVYGHRLMLVQSKTLEDLVDDEDRFAHLWDAGLMMTAYFCLCGSFSPCASVPLVASCLQLCPCGVPKSIQQRKKSRQATPQVGDSMLNITYSK